ncbi:5-formyltetrahydrofolate cyclo-ligase [Demequina sp. SYSU T00039]|uniref:5-formyltetrahydrofolate cyclo-ligase n=1 Tax=Demequina lignilytica TaxID=3051663 RepID=A0AAW7M318_9MICO|nr:MULTISPECIES: 5-formyltetrahydrofolate cyclo-ligase [unclassified Demequina]MDN4477550.1 5-formyltetrahydrofolate cyclo-ligase [Demequina sp. SYSU T00039-1]MDN4488099.1 5-formyltetrahydrofolate cyclo-ligase [Demequina sp. SYSU T00039]MDN4490540.1 5-formyltetrahydrofolate cyclo-ligase [Demequina sp. SYSU T00068]
MTPMSEGHLRAPEPDEAKAHLRAVIRRERLQRSERRRHEAAAAFRDHVLALPAVQAASCVSVYASRPHEPSTGPLIEALHVRGVRVLIPLLGDGLQRGWGVYRGVDDLVERAPGRPPEPSGDFLGSVTLAEADVIVVPALAVDTSGTRLGQGGGWYDRALVDAKPDAPVVALTFSGEVRDAATDPLPREPHDLGVDMVITPEGAFELGA